jgi:putative ABC transport system permease protein
MFMTGINVKTGWERYVNDAALDRHYDLEVRLNDPQPEQKIYSIITSIPGVQKVETWNYTPAALYRPDGLDIVRTYPDGGHGSFTLRSAPPESNLMGLALLAGRWLKQMMSMQSL